MKKLAKSRKPDKSRQTRLQLTPEIQALYFQCLAGKTLHLSPADQSVIVQLLDRQFPALPRAARQAQRRSRSRLTIASWGFGLATLGIALFLIFGCEAHAEVGPDLIRAAQEQAEASMDRAWRQGSENDTQPVNTLIGSDGSVVLAQNAPRRIVNTASWPQTVPGLSDDHTTITVIYPNPTPVPTPRPRPTPLPTPAPKQETRVQTTVNGLDKIETRALLPEDLNVGQLDAVKKITDNGKLIAQQRFDLEEHKINQETELEYLRIVKSFVLWGFLASIPFLFSAYWILKNMFSGYHALQKDIRDYKLKELESSERILYGKGKK